MTLNDFIAQCKATLEDNPDLSQMILTDIELTTEMISYVCQIISTHRNIKEVDFTNASLSDESIKILCEELKKCDHVRSLDLSNNAISTPAVKHIRELLKGNNTLEILILNELNNYTNKYLDRINTKLENNKNGISNIQANASVTNGARVTRGYSAASSSSNSNNSSPNPRAPYDLTNLANSM